MRTRTRTVWVATVGALVTAGLVAVAGPASAHVEVEPATAVAGQPTTYTITVPDERDDVASTGIRLDLPPGFELDVAQQVPGWRTVIAKGKDGIARSVTWTDGLIPVGTYATFGLQGRNRRSTGPMVFRAVQHYPGAVVTWDGPEGSDTPAPTVRLGSAPAVAVPGQDGGATGTTTAAATTSSGSGPDALARSRAAFALAVAVVALLLGLAPAGLAAARRRSRSHDTEVQGAEVQRAQVQGAAVRAAEPQAATARRRPRRTAV